MIEFKWSSSGIRFDFRGGHTTMQLRENVSIRRKRERHTTMHNLACWRLRLRRRGKISSKLV